MCGPWQPKPWLAAGAPSLGSEEGAEAAALQLAAEAAAQAHAQAQWARTVLEEAAAAQEREHKRRRGKLCGLLESEGIRRVLTCMATFQRIYGKGSVRLARA